MVVPESASFDTPTIASALTLLTVTIKSVLDHRKGKSRDTSGSQQLSSIRKSIGEMRTDLGEMRGELRDLKGHVIGPDGQNGLRGDVKELKEDVRGILDRERNVRPMYDRRST